MSSKVLDYSDVKKELPQRAHVLIGNGFSIGCDKRFQYPNLFEYACKHRLSSRAQALFTRLGTNNFEGALRLLHDARWTAKRYGVKDKEPLREMKNDISIIKNTLVEAVAETHLLHAGEVSDKKKECCGEFLSDYFNIFTTNYDLLLYWVAMAGPNELRTQDGFRAPLDDEDSEYLVFREHTGSNRGMFFLHGALHLHVISGEVRKHCWERSKKRLTTLIKEALDDDIYPLFVAEGLPERKKQQSGYLSYCLGKLERIQKAIVIYGHSLGDSDEHIFNTIADNPEISNVYVGLFDKDSPKALAVRTAAETMSRRRKQWQRTRKAKDLTINYYDSKTAPVWGK